MSRPTDDLHWADDGAADVVEPNAGKKDVGWVSDEEPPAQYFNWFMREVAKWIEYLDGDGHQTYTIWLPASKAAVTNALTFDGTGIRHIITPSASRIESLNAGAIYYEWPLDMLREGDRILSITLYGDEGNAAGETYDGRLYSVAEADGTKTGITALKTSGVTGNNTTLAWSTADSGLSPSGYTVPADTPLVFGGELKISSSDGEIDVVMLKITYDRP